MKTVLFVGSRGAALDAAQRLGLRALLLAERPVAGRVRRRVERWRVLDRAGGLDEAVEGARSMTGDERPDAVVALTERAVVPAAAIRERLGVPGASIEVAGRCRDKVLMKTTARAAGIACTDFVEIEASTPAEELIDRLGLPVVVKQRASSGGRGMTIARTPAEVARSLRPGWLAERFVHGVEMSYETLVAGGRPVFGNPTEYVVPGWANLVPGRLDDGARAEIEAFNARVVAAFGIPRGMTHLEIFRTPDGPVFGEIAARPPGGYLMDLMGCAYGFDPWEILLRIELGEPVDPPRRASGAAANWILHPGPGVCRAVGGLDEARALPGVESVRCRLGSGGVVSRRVGTGQDVGWVLVTSATPDEAVATLRAARDRIRIEMER